MVTQTKKLGKAHTNTYAHRLTVLPAEFMLRLVLYDPTNYGSSGFSVMLFEKAKNALPTVESGDILMFRGIQVRRDLITSDIHFPQTSRQIDRFNNALCAVGASFKGWQWAVFHVKTGMLSSAPEDTCALRHFKPEGGELQFSIRLGDWWRDVSSNATSFAPNVSRAGGRGREHKLIADATGDEYFDTTVEVSSACSGNACVVFMTILLGSTRTEER